MSEHSSPGIDDLIRKAERAAAATTDQVRLVAELVRLIGDRGADPYLLIGGLAVHSLVKHVPLERPEETTEQLGRLPVKRLEAHGLA